MMRNRWVLWMVLIVLTCGSSGCRLDVTQDVDSEYGHRSGRKGRGSVNGTSVLARMFREGGARVRTTGQLGRTVDRSDVVVWIPDRYSPPGQRSIQHLENWINERPGRTLIYVGRNYDATADYWRHVVDHTSTEYPEQYLESRRKLAKARVAQTTQSSVYPETQECDWFSMERSPTPQKIDDLNGRLSRGVDAKKVDIQRITHLGSAESGVVSKFQHWGTPKVDALLTAHDKTLVQRVQHDWWDRGQIIVVADGSWLLNLPLVNHEHRRLAGNLIAECGDVKDVVFLESGPGEPPIARHEANEHHGMTAFTIWPINCILMHLLALGVLFCFTAFPIFGRPEKLPDSDMTDFGQHIDAIGNLMERTGDRQFAIQCLTNYQQRVADTKTALVDTPDTSGR